MQISNQSAPLTQLFAKLEENKDKEGYSFLEHLKEMFDRILLNPNAYPLEKFEELSYLIKLTHLKLKPPPSEEEIRNMNALLSHKQEWVNRYLAQLTIVHFTNIQILGKYIKNASTCSLCC